MRVRALLTTAVVAASIGPAAAAVYPSAGTPSAAPLRIVGAPVDEITTTTAAVAPPPTSTTAATIGPVKLVRRVSQPVGDGANDKNKPDTRPKPKPQVVPFGTPFVGKLDGPDIEGYARYEGESTCDPSPKPGTVALRDVLLARYPATSSAGISRACDDTVRSEHEEGRAFDWAANVSNASQRAAVEDFLTQLFATDAFGHRHALARRMGVMYVIWNHQIWGAYAADDGWRLYTGSSPHTDHVHISMSWAGARAETSFWSGRVVPGLPDGTRLSIPDGPTVTTRAPRRRPTTTTTTRLPRTTTTTTTAPSSSTSTTSSSTTSTTSRYHHH